MVDRTSRWKTNFSSIKSTAIHENIKENYITAVRTRIHNAKVYM